MIRRALSGREVDSATGFRIILYSYCMAFKISPAQAQHTPIKLILDMLHIHAEVEKMKNQEIDREMKKNVGQQNFR